MDKKSEVLKILMDNFFAKPIADAKSYKISKPLPPLTVLKLEQGNRPYLRAKKGRNGNA